MTEAFINMVLCGWGYMDTSTLLFRPNGDCPQYRVGRHAWRGVHDGKPLIHFTALTWPS